MSTRTILLGRAGSGKTRVVLDRLAQALDAGRGASSLVLVPTLSQASHLKRALVSRSRYPGIRGFFDESIVNFTSLAELILGGETIGELLSGLRQEVLLRGVLRRCRHPSFRPVSRYPGFRRAALEFLKELKQNGLGREETEARLAASVESLTGVARDRLEAFREVYRRYEDARAQAGLLDHEDYLAACRDRLEERSGGGAGSRLEFDSIGVDGFQNFTRLERETLLLLAGASAETTVTLTYDPALERSEAGPFRVSHETYRFLLEHGFRRKLLAGNCRAGSLGKGEPVLAALEGRLFRAPTANLEAGESVRVLAAADPEDEAERVARTVRRHAGDHRYRDFLIVARDLPTRKRRFARAFARHGLPLRIFCGESPVEHAYVRSAMNLLRLAAGDVRAERILALLRSDHLDAIGASEADRFEESLSEDSGAATLAEWAERVGGVSTPAREALLSVEQWGTRIGETDGGALPLEEWPGEIRLLLSGVLSPLWGRDLSDEEHVRREAWAHRVFLETVQETAHALRLDQDRATLLELLELVGEALREITPRLPDRRLDVVNMVDAREARQWEAEVVFVCGLVEGEFPRSPREDPLLADRERRLLNEQGTLSLREVQNERDEERFLFYVAATRPRFRLYLTYPLTDGGGEECAPSAFLRDLLAQLADSERVVSERRLAEPLPLAPERAGPEDLRLVAFDGLLSARSQAERDRATALHNLLIRGGPIDDRAYQRALRLGLKFGRRLSTRLTAPDRVAARHPTSRGHSPSSLEDFGNCPFRHFAGRSLALRAAPSPIGGGVDRALLGEIGHEALRRVFEAVLRGDPVPPAAEATEVFRDTVRERTGGRSPGLGEDRALRLLETSVLEVVERERVRLAGSDFRPHALEAAFGGRERGVAVRGEDGREVRLRGRLDRIDAAPDGRGLVIEYKLGRAFVKRTLAEIEEGNELQMPAYLLALREAFGLRPAGVWIATLLPAGTGGLVMEGAPEPDRSFPLCEEDLERMLEGLGARVLEIDDRIRAGEIAVAPRDRRVCDYCDFGDLCRIEAWQWSADVGAETLG